MENKKSVNISLSTFFLILAIIVIIAMVCYIYIDKTNSNREIKGLEANITEMQDTISNLQEELNNTNIIESTTNQSTSSNSISFTDTQVKEALSNYLELRSNANCDNLLETLTSKGKLNYNPSSDNILDDGKVITTIRFSDYKKAMLNYVSEAEFERNWHSTQYFTENSNGYLTKVQGGGSLAVYTIKSISKNSDMNYTAKTSYIIDENDSEPAQDENFTFTIKSSNNNCVIDNINSNE